MTVRTAARRSAVLGLGALGALALAAPATALDAPAPVGDALAPVTSVVDPLTAPLQSTVAPAVEPAAAPVAAAVEETVASVSGTAPADTGAPVVTQPPAGGGTTTTPGGQAPQTTTPPAQQPAGAAPGGAPAAGGAGVASMPSSFTRTATSLEGFSAGAGTGGFGTAANPMSLFGAPQVATAPVLGSDIPTPLAVTPAGGALADVLPVDAPDGLPGALVALASAVVAGTVAAHVAALRSRGAAVTA